MTEDYYNLEQVEMAIQAAERLVGQATMSMDESQLENASKALAEAREKLERAKLAVPAHDLVQYSASRLNRLTHQVDEAKN